MQEKEENQSEQRDLNPRPTAPKAVALAKLRYAPISVGYSMQKAQFLTRY